MATLSDYNFEELGYPVDTLKCNDGTEFQMVFFKHSSLLIIIDGKYIYIDPVTSHADYDRLPKADLILFSHHHYDHYEPEAVYKLQCMSTHIICDVSTAQLLSELSIVTTPLRPNQSVTPFDFLKIDTVAAYNYSEGRTQFHPKQREDLGYVLEFHSTRLYIAGDGEDTPEMKSQKNIDIALLPVNQPYTMTIEQAAEAVKAINPKIFYPYHYGQVEEVTDLEKLDEKVSSICAMRVRGME